MVRKLDAMLQWAKSKQPMACSFPVIGFYDPLAAGSIIPILPIR